LKLSLLLLIQNEPQLLGFTEKFWELIGSSVGNFLENVNEAGLGRVPSEEELSLSNSQKTKTEPSGPSKTTYKLLSPIYCSKCSTLGSVVSQLCSLGIHRVWIVDELKCPVGVVSLYDILKVLYLNLDGK
jgi:hypothetical protein